MASKDKPKKHEAGRKIGGSKSSRRSAQTVANKRRAAETRESRLVRAAERRTKATSVDPTTGKTKRGASVRDAREIQSGRIARKREQRRKFAKLSPREKEEARILGRRQFRGGVK